MRNLMTSSALRVALAGATLLTAWPAAAINWDAVPANKLNLFYPGQRSWEFVLTPSEHSGYARFRGGKNCRQCHDGEEKKFGNDIGKALGTKRPTSIEAEMRVARDDKGLHFRFEWTPTGYVENPKLDPEYEHRVTVMFVEDRNRLARRAGCWAACHDDLRAMPSFDKKADLTMYLPVSRTEMSRQGGGENYKPPKRIRRILEAGLFYEYWQARIPPGKPAVAKSGWILEKRHEHDKPVVTVSSTVQNGRNVVVITRPWSAFGDGVKRIAPKGTYMLGFAIHDGHAAGRTHYISFEKTLGFDDDSEADYIAAKQ